MNILIINHYAGSPKHGMEYRPYYLAKEWLKLGHKVTIIAASQSHLRQQQPLTTNKITRENIEGINYTWLKTPEYRGNGFRRVLNMLSFGKQLYYSYPKILSEFSPDLVIASSPHPFIIRGAKRIAKQYKAKLIFEVRDLWPLSLIELGNINPLHPFVLLMKNEEEFAYKESDSIVSLLSNASGYMQQHGMSKNKFRYIPNGIIIDNNEISHKTSKAQTALSPEIEKKLQHIKQNHVLLVCFAGSHGIANALDYLIDAASILASTQAKEAIGFILVGSGSEKNKLKAKASMLQNVFFFDPIQKAEIPIFLKKMDVLYIGLQKQNIFKYGVSPNKLFDYMMAAKPIIHAIETENNIIEKSGCGISCKAENASAIAKAIMQIKNTTENKRILMGEKGKKYVIEHHNYQVLAKNYLLTNNN